MNAPTPEQSKVPPQAVLMQMAFGFVLSQAVSVAARLCIADHLADGPKTSEELAEDCGAHAPSLFRLLRALAKAGIFVRDGENKFSNTDISEFLRSDHPESMRAMAHMTCDKEHWLPQGNLEHSVRTGESAFEFTFGSPAFPYMAAHPEAAATFDEAMTNLSNAIGRAAATSYDFSKAATVADIGGGHGILLVSVLQANPHLKGVLFDQPQVVEGARHAETAGLADRTEIVAGDFFSEIPVDADVYMMKHIIHDWNDEESIQIMSNIARAARPGARLLLVEAVVEDEDVPSLTGLMDLNMLAMTTGRERTAAEYAELMERSGFKFVGVHETPSPMQLIEGERVNG
jgi:ubiquinone/menaquinone biosynthesis C-methylase UbiE